jgi:hypothetical protein
MTTSNIANMNAFNGVDTGVVNGVNEVNGKNLKCSLLSIPNKAMHDFMNDSMNNSMNNSVNNSMNDSVDASSEDQESEPENLNGQNNQNNKRFNDLMNYVNHTHKYSEYDHVYKTAPSDVVIPESDKIDESESIEGSHSDSETEDMHRRVDMNETSYVELELQRAKIKQEWSPTKTMESIVNKTGPHVNNDVYQVLVGEMVKDKCWNDDDFISFIKSMSLIRELTNTTNDSKRLELLLNPQYYNAIHDAIDKLDTINVVCVFSTGDKCERINNPVHREIMKKQILLLGRLVDIYTPIFIRIILLIEKFTKELSQPGICNLSPTYVNAIKALEDRIIGSLYMRRLNKMKDYPEKHAYLKHMSMKSKDDNMHESDTEVELNPKPESDTHETFVSSYPIDQSSSLNYQPSDYFVTILFLLVVGLIIYILFMGK